MSHRISPIAAFGSLLKGSTVPRERVGKPAKIAKRAKPAKPSRDLDPKYLAAVRRCPCLSCDNDPAGEAAHVRMTRAGKEIAGTGSKPADRWSLPLCRACHTGAPSAQHRVGEVAFWSALGLDPLAIAARLYAVSPDVPAMRNVIFKEREGRK